MAVERAIMLARRYRSPRAFRTVALVGSDHGRTLLCRTASGRPELQEDLGPLVAGFSHVPPGDLDALDVAVDEQTACVLISPNLWSRGGEVLDAAYLKEVQRLCNQRDVLLAVDESQVVFGATGQPLAICSIADVRPDLVVLSSGLFGGLPGGITLASRRVTGGEDRCEIGFPLLAAVLSTTMRSIRQQGLLASVSDSAESLAIELAERVSAFEFVRDVHALGLSIGLETDLSSTTLVQTAASRGVRLEAAGETAIRIQPPLALNDEDRRILIAAIEETFSSIQLSAADLSV
jgi:acetylornithine/N-succinyldiaminopimelate aminotransferase